MQSEENLKVSKLPPVPLYSMPYYTRYPFTSGAHFSLGFHVKQTSLKELVGVNAFLSVSIFKARILGDHARGVININYTHFSVNTVGIDDVLAN